MSSRTCSHCGCTDIDIDSARGDAVCTGCGSVLEDQIIVAEVQFQENSGGGSSLIGQFVSSEASGKSFSIGGSFSHGMQKESRTITLQKGRRRIQQLANQLNLNQHCVDIAFNFFKMAVAKHMTQGRKHMHVIAACLYLVCRTEKTSHMLLDFSDALQVNIYTLGHTYLQLSKELCLNLPDVDPCLYIARFAHGLQFGEKTHEVSMTAMRLVQRMKRDWMSTGRRPSGLCGAALLVAARIHEFSRSVKEIIKVVKVCHATLKKRLLEFEDTPSSHLTIEEFQTIDLEEEHDPPAFTEGKRRTKMINEQSKLGEYSSEVSKIQQEIEDLLLKQKPRGIYAHYAKMADNLCSLDSETSSFSDILDNDSKSVDQTTCDSTTAEMEVFIPNNMDDSFVKETILYGGETYELENNSSLNEECLQKELIIGSEVNVLSSASGGEVTESDVLLKIPSLVLGVQETAENCMKEGSEHSQDGVTDGNDELDLTGIDDAEINEILLSEKEIEVKTKLWMAENADYLEEQRLKAEKKAKEAEEEAKKPADKKKRTFKKKKRPPAQEASSAQEAIQKIMLEKKISCKINYDVLNGLNNIKSTPPKSTPVKVGAAFGSILMDDKLSIQQLRKSNVTFDLSSKQQPLTKKARLKGPSSVLSQNEVKLNTDVVVVESGPVNYMSKDDGDLVDEYEDNIEEEEEEDHVSAAQLFGNAGAEDDYDYDDD